MGEGEDLGVQGDTADGIAARAVFFITHDRMPEILHMHTDLVFPACLEIDLEQAEPVVPAYFPVVGDGLFARLGIGRGVHPKALVSARYETIVPSAGSTTPSTTPT